MNTKQSNRVKILFINYRQMMEILCGKTAIKNIPEFTKIIDMHYIRSFAFGFQILIEHPSFPEVPEGIEPPMFYADCEIKNNSSRKLYFD